MDGKDRVYVAKGAMSVSVPLHPMYQEYQMVGYQENLNNYKKIITDILNSYKFKLDLNNVYPLIKSKSFKIQKEYICEDLFCDLSVYWVTDFEDVFRFVSTEDMESANIDINTLKIESRNNLNKMTNPLVRLDNSHKIYTLRFDTDYAATLFLSENIQEQIKRKIGNDILFCMPSSMTLLCAKYQKLSYKTYTHILKQLIAIDNDVNKISDKIYRRNKDGKYSIIA
ncbi:DUF1444 family protein [Tissierella sp.]|uniref:DUF1444 family protein n=1 Tax=Tissierella sp. TaxID=41274 RepID=UPI00286EA963|nr:DUF1444 family protein [Tissierella sp.]